MGIENGGITKTAEGGS